MITETQEHRQLRLSIEREFGIGIGGRSETWTMGESEMREVAAQVAAKRRRRAGFRALEAKVGHETARQIIRGTR